MSMTKHSTSQAHLAKLVLILSLLRRVRVKRLSINEHDIAFVNPSVPFLGRYDH